MLSGLWHTSMAVGQKEVVWCYDFKPTKEVPYTVSLQALIK